MFFNYLLLRTLINIIIIVFITDHYLEVELVENLSFSLQTAVVRDS